MKLLLFFLLPSVASGAENHSAENHRYALVVTNNRSLDLGRPDLRYADDDGVQYALLFGDIFGAQNVTLLTTFDRESERLYPSWVQSTRAPSRAIFFAEVKKLTQQLAADRAAGATSEVYLVFAGHGDVDHGQGFVELADARLTARELDQDVISVLPANKIHLVLDSCNSYFMLNPRKPGGRHFASDAAATPSLFDRHKNLGAIISTSAEAVTYEWSEIQSGIFSYLVRSALRGGADTTGDGRLTYAAVAAFISVATEGVVNDLYRPKVFAHAPSNTTEFLDWSQRPANATQLVVPAGREHRLTIRDSQGVRVADLHTEPKSAATLVLPSTGGSFEVSESKPIAGGRHEVVVWTLAAAQRLELTDAGAPRTVAVRGESPVFSGLFASPFGPNAEARFAEMKEEPIYGISRTDAERLRLHLKTAAAFAYSDRIVTSGIYGALGLSGAGFYVAEQVIHRHSGFSPADNSSTSVILGLSVGGIITSVIVYFWLGPVEKLAASYDARDLSTEAGRAAAVSEGEAAFEALAKADENRRHWIGGTALAVGVLATAGEIALMSTSRNIDLGQSAAVLVLGVTDLVLGIFQLTVMRTPVERMWKQYVSETSGDSDRLQLAPTLAPVPSGQGAQVGLVGRF